MCNLSYHRHRFPAEVIQYAVWLYFRFPLSYCDVEDMPGVVSTAGGLCIGDDAVSGFHEREMVMDLDTRIF